MRGAIGRCWPLEAGPQTRDGGAQAPEMSCGSCKCPGDVWHGYQSWTQPEDGTQPISHVQAWSHRKGLWTYRQGGQQERFYPGITPEKKMGWEMSSPTLSPALLSNTLTGRITSPGAMGQHHTVWQRRPQAPMDTSVTSEGIRAYQDMSPGASRFSVPQTVHFWASQAATDTSPLGFLSADFFSLS